MSGQWTLRHWWRLFRAGDDYFRALEGWPYSFEPMLEDGSAGKTVMWCWPLPAPALDLVGWTAQLHKFVAIDEREPWHTHQASLAFRAILFGSYTERVRRPDGRIITKVWRKGDVGVITAAYDHRMVEVGPEGAISLWIRGPTRHQVRWRWPSGAERILTFKDMQ